MFAVWRLATVIQHKAAMWPVKDPTWYGPISILLAVLEVDCASICASVPVFWPVLSRQLGKIFVTKEIEIIHEDRYEFDNYAHSWTETELRTKPGSSYKEIQFNDSFVNPLWKTPSAGSVEVRSGSEAESNRPRKS